MTAQLKLRLAFFAKRHHALDKIPDATRLRLKIGFDQLQSATPFTRTVIVLSMRESDQPIPKTLAPGPAPFNPGYFSNCTSARYGASIASSH